MWRPVSINSWPAALSNIFNDLPNCFNSGTAAMYADDTTVTFSSENTACLGYQINIEFLSFGNWLIANKLSFNISEIEFRLATKRQKRAFIDEY